jgi:SAM-dependent methyltransferase
MSYDPKTYWPARYAKEGPLGCARRGMDHAASERQADAFWSHIGPRIPRPCARLLDFGCGPGRMRDHVRRELPAAEYHGADMCLEAIRMASDRIAPDPLTAFVLIPPTGMPQFPDGHFNCVVCCTVLQHLVADDDFALWTKEIARVTRPGGVVVVLDGVGCKASHARSRAPEEVGRALGMELAWHPSDPESPIDLKWALVDAESKGSHWVASFVKGA